MRIKIEFAVEKLPLSYRMLFVSLTKEAIKIGDQQLYRQLYVDGNSKPKKYSFAIFMMNFQKKDNIFEMERANMTISSSDPQIAVALINGFQQMKEFTYQSWKIKITKIELHREKQIQQSIVQFQTLSPILLEDKQKNPLLITDSQFENEMNFVVNKQFMQQYGRELIEPIRIINHELKKQVVQEKNSGSGKQVLFFTCQKGKITLKGDKEDLTLIYQDGFLVRKSQGMGMLEVVKCYGESNS